MRVTLLLSTLLTLSFNQASFAQNKQAVDENFGNFSIVSAAKTQEVPANRALILIKPVVQLDKEILTCDSAYFSLNKKFEAFGHVNLRKSNGKNISTGYMSIDVIENSIYNKKTIVSR